MIGASAGSNLCCSLVVYGFINVENRELILVLSNLFNYLDLKMSIGVPIKVLHEAEGHIVTCETNTGEVYRGKLVEAEDNMNCQMTSVTVTYRDGKTASVENVYIRGSKIRFLILPDMLKNAPMFKRHGAKIANAGAGNTQTQFYLLFELGFKR